MRRGIAGVAIALVVAAAAISGCGDDRTTTVTVKEPVTTATTAVPSADKQADKKLGRAIVLRLADLPSGWTAEDDDDDKDDSPKCVDLRTSASAVVSSPDFANNSDHLTGGVFVYPSEADATAVFPSPTDQELRKCIAGLLTDALKKEDDLDVKKATTGLQKIGTVADDALGMRIAIPIETSGISIEPVYTYVLLREGRTIQTIIFASDDGEFDSYQRDRLVSELAKRAKRALANDS